MYWLGFRSASSWKLLVYSCVLLFGLSGQSVAQNLTLTSGSVGGGYFQIAAALSDYIKRENPEISSTVIPGGGWANVERLHTGLADIAVIENAQATLAWRGESPTGEKYDFRMMTAVRGPSIAQAFIPNSRNVASFEQIAEEKLPLRIATFEPAQLASQIAVAILEEYGISRENLESWGGQLIFTSLEEGFRMINDGIADMWFTGASGYPHPSAMELGTKETFRVLSISDEVATAVAQKYGASVGDVPANIYADSHGENEAYRSPFLVVGFAVRTSLDEDLVYRIKDALWKYRDEFREMHPQHALYGPEFAWQAVGEAPLHPGAERWYREKGFMD
jgi:uncharacterized protein